MKSWFTFILGLFLGARLLAEPMPLQSQSPSATNSVLELDGKGSYIELPPRIFDGLTALTVEAWWVKWDKFGPGGGDVLFFCFGDEG
jgi:hypothetical protein